MTKQEHTAQSHMIDLPAGPFHYLSWNAEETEKAERSSVVLLHGITSSAQSWVRVGPRLAERYQVYALDQRGHGDSVKPGPGAYNLRHTADDVAAFIEALGLEQPVLIGHSWGGATAMTLASRSGAEKAPPLAQVILEDPAHNFGRGDLEQRSIAFTRDIGRPPNELRTELTLTSPGWTQADIEGKIEALQKVSREAVLNVFIDAGQQGELLPLLDKITTPTLLIRADPALGSTLDEAAWERAKWYLSERSRAIQIDGASHNIHRSKFEEFMQVVDEFLER